MLRLAVLVSGGGTNLQAILDAIDEGIITNAEVSVFISNNAGARRMPGCDPAEHCGCLSE